MAGRRGRLLDVLRASNLRIITEASFTIGAPRLREFERAVTSSQRTLLVLSPAYLADDIQQFVDILDQTQDLESDSWRIIPIILPPVDLPLRLRSLVSLDATTPQAQELSMQRLLAALAVPEIVEAEKPDCPFPGIVPFTENAAPRFFGRDSEIQDLMASPSWDHIQGNRMEIAPLDAAGLRAAIEKPAQSAGVSIEPVLIDRLIRDGASEPGALPLVQETLVLLWDRLERRYLSLRTYQALASGSDRTGLQVAIARRADAAFAQLSPGEQQVARRVFLRLVSIHKFCYQRKRNARFGGGGGFAAPTPKSGTPCRGIQYFMDRH